MHSGVAGLQLIIYIDIWKSHVVVSGFLSSHEREVQAVAELIFIVGYPQLGFVLRGSIIFSPYISMRYGNKLNILPDFSKFLNSLLRAESVSCRCWFARIAAVGRVFCYLDFQFSYLFASFSVENSSWLSPIPRILQKICLKAPCYFAEQHVQ